MPDISTVHLDQLLTNLSVRYANNNFIGPLLFPIIPVSKQTGKYPVYGKERFKLYDDVRRPGSEAFERPSWRMSTDFYDCEGHAQKEAIPDELRANADIDEIDVQTTEDLTDSVKLRHEIYVYNAFFGAGTAVPTVALAGGALWSDYINGDPIQAVEAQKVVIQKATGKLPNSIAVSMPVFLQLRNHPKIVDRFKYTQVGILQPDHLKAVFNLDNFFVAAALKDTTNIGQASTLDYIWGKNVVLCYVPPAPGKRTVAVGYTFSWIYGVPGNQGFFVKRYREEKRTADIIEVQWYYQPKVVVPSAAFTFSPAVA